MECNPRFVHVYTLSSMTCNGLNFVQWTVSVMTALVFFVGIYFVLLKGSLSKYSLYVIERYMMAIMVINLSRVAKGFMSKVLLHWWTLLELLMLSVKVKDMNALTDLPKFHEQKQIDSTNSNVV